MLKNQVNLAEADISDLENIQNKSAIAESLKLATMIVSSVPVLILYPFVQKHFVKGMMVGSVKG